jgi:hypothetical protein
MLLQESLQLLPVCQCWDLLRQLSVELGCCCMLLLLGAQSGAARLELKHQMICFNSISSL